MPQILIIEDEAIIRASLARLLERQGHTVVEAASIQEAERKSKPADMALIIADLRLPGEPGTAIIGRAPGVPVLIMTSYASVRSAVDAMKQGAIDYIAKPFNHDEMVLTVDRILKQRRIERQNELLRSELSSHYPVRAMIGRCPAMQEVFQRIERVAPTDTTVLILGESGTGKELVARAVHAQSGRRESPIVTVNCATIPATLIESELFGHEKGAFTGAVEMRRGLIEVADGGTLFLDEIGELSTDLQARLLRVLQEGEIRRVGSNHSRQVDIRLIAATNRDLGKLVESGQFREDLYYRLHVMEIRLPPLRERGGDVVELAEVLLTRSCQRLNRSRLQFSDDAIEAMRGYHWPGNVRELENVIERAVILAESDTINARGLALNGHTPPAEVGGLPSSLDDYFVQFVTANEGSMSETELANHLGISRKTLWVKRQKFNLPRRR